MHCTIHRTATRVATIVVATMLAMSAVAQAQRATGRQPASKPAAKTTNRVTSADDGAKGFVLGVYTIGAPGVTVGGQDLEGAIATSFGVGAGVMVGYDFNKRFSAYASGDLAKQDANGTFSGSFGLRHLEIGGRANIPYGSETTVPYVSASIGRRAMGARVVDHTDDSEYDLTVSGGMVGIGGGVQHAFSPTLSMDSGLELGFGRFGHYNSDGEQGSLDVNGSTSIRLRVGVIWRPAARR
jgi:hypothetical protein